MEQADDAQGLRVPAVVRLELMSSNGVILHERPVYPKQKKPGTIQSCRENHSLARRINSSEELNYFPAPPFSGKTARRML
jgi:hypothetical protein